jgi:hypothetical protein
VLLLCYGVLVCVTALLRGVNLGGTSDTFHRDEEDKGNGELEASKFCSEGHATGL